MARRTGARTTVVLLKRGEEDNDAESLRSFMFKSTAEELGLTPVDPFIKVDENKYKIKRGGNSQAFTLVYKDDQVPSENASGRVDVPVPANCTIVDFFEFVNETLSDEIRGKFEALVTPDGISYGISKTETEAPDAGVNTPDPDAIGS